MNKLNAISKYLIIAILFTVVITVTIPAQVNASDGDDPYHLCIVEPIQE